MLKCGVSECVLVSVCELVYVGVWKCWWPVQDPQSYPWAETITPLSATNTWVCVYVCVCVCKSVICVYV